VAFACLVVIFIGSRLRTRWRWLLALYPMAMGLALVYLGEHYVIDLLAGLVYAVAVHFGLSAWERARAAKRAGIAPAEGPLEPEGAGSLTR
jgi:membrane-associated phospholipid phosphatase